MKGLQKKIPLLTLLVLFFCLQSAAGDTLEPYWAKPITGVALSTPSSQAGSVAAIVDGGSVKAYTWNGNLLWEYYASGRLLPFITRTWDGISYICRTNGTLIAINRAGAELRRINIRDSLVSPVVEGWDGRIFVPTEKKISCYNNAGVLLWSKELAERVAIPPMLDKRGGLIMVLEDATLLQVDAFGRSRSRKLDAAPALVVSLAVTYEEWTKNDIIDTVLIIYKDGKTELIGKLFGEDFGRERSFPNLAAPPLAAKEYDDKVAIALTNGTLAVFSVAGDLLWEADTNIRTGDSDLIFDHRGIYVLSTARALGFFATGSAKWALDIKYAATIPAFGEEGVLYSGGSDWILYAYRLEDRGLGWDDSPYGAVPKGKYGLGTLPEQRADYYNKFSDYQLSFQFSRIREKLKTGQLGAEEPEIITYLKEAAASVRNSLSIRAERQPVFLLKRIEAVRLLADIGSEELVEFFADLLLGDKDPLMKVAAAEAIGRIGVDPDGFAMKAFSRAINPPNAINDVQALSAIASAIGSLCRVSGPAISVRGIPLLVALTAPDKPTMARNRALQELKKLEG